LSCSPVQVQGNGFDVGQGPADVQQLARRHGQGRVRRALFLRPGGDLQFQIGGDERGASAHHFHQHIGEDRQGVLAFDHAGHRLQGFEQGVLGGFKYKHLYIPDDSNRSGEFFRISAESLSKSLG
jgi:hypothetical protein